MKEASSTIVVGKRAVCVFGISYNISYRSVSVLFIYDIPYILCAAIDYRPDGTKREPRIKDITQHSSRFSLNFDEPSQAIPYARYNFSFPAYVALGVIVIFPFNSRFVYRK